jgi:Domain of unknown function (DUF932)
MAKMPEAMQIAPGDECLKYLLLSNSHTGEGSVSVKFTSVRVVCQNTLMMAMDDGQKAYRVRHSKKMQFRLEELADFLAVTQEVFLKAEECFRRLAKIQMIENRLERYFEAVYPRSLVQKRKEEDPPRWDFLREILCGGPTPTRGKSRCPSPKFWPLTLGVLSFSSNASWRLAPSALKL